MNIRALLAAFSSALFAVAAKAQERSGAASEHGGLGKWLIDTTFEAGSLSKLPDSPGWIGTVIMPMSMVAMSVAALIIIVKSIQHLLITAQAKDPSASPISMTWAPIHLVLAVVLVMPLPSGYSLGQYAGLWVGDQSNTLGNISSERGLDFIGNQGAISPPPVPELQHFAKAAISSNFCKVMYESGYQYLKEEFNPDSSTTITPVIHSASSNGDDDSGHVTRRIDFERRGDFANEGSEINDYCGSMSIGYARYKNEPINVGGACSSGETGSLLCGALSHSKEAEALGQELNLVHRELSDVLADTAVNSETTVNIARNLLYDIDVYLAGKTDGARAEDYIAIQAEESERIDQAVNLTVRLYEDLQKRAYAGYAQAIRSRNSKTEAGEDWLDKAYEGGWPLFGLYWFQMTKTSQRTLSATELSFTGSSDANIFIDRFAAEADDPILSARLTARWKRYTDRLEREIQNSRHDIMPTVTQRYDESGRAIDMDGNPFQSTQVLSETRNLLPGIKKEMLQLSATGNMEHEGLANRVSVYFNDWTKGILFPGIVGWMKEGDIVTSMVNTGHNLISIHETLYIINLFLRASKSAQEAQARIEQRKGMLDKALDVVQDTALAVTTAGASQMWTRGVGLFESLTFGTLAGQVLITLFTDFVKVFTALFIVAIFMAFYIPSIILIQWLIGIVTWLVYLVEAIVVIPLWGLLFVSDMGSQSLAPQSARQGLVHILSILFYPTLMVIGFVVGIKVVDVASTFFIDFLVIGINNMTEDYAFGIVSLAAALAIIGFAAYQLITRIFSLVLEFNQRMMNWIGQYNNYGEQNVESQIRQGFIAFVNQGNQATKNLTQSPKDGAKSDPTAGNR